MQLFKRHVSPHELILFAVEIIVICAAMLVAIRLHGAADATVPWQILPAAALCQLCLYYNDVYDLTQVQSGRELLVRLVQAAGAASPSGLRRTQTTTGSGLNAGPSRVSSAPPASSRPHSSQAHGS